MWSQQIETKSRLLAKLLREILAREAFESLADVTDALKARCGRLRVRYTPDDIASAFQLVGSNHDLVVPPTPISERPISTPDPLNPLEASRVYREIRERFVAGRPVVAASMVAPEVDADLVRRLSACQEPLALAFFWDRHAAGADRLELLLLFEAVTIARPGGWKPQSVRSTFETQRTSWRPVSGCFGCARHEELSLHHVITIDHGGSNAVRNLVPVCVGCHLYLHPWLTTARHRRHGFESLGQIAGAGSGKK